MSSPLIDQLAQRLALTPLEAERALNAFVEDLHTRLQKEGEVHYEALGTFRLEKGQIRFEPARALDLATNYRYAGLDPLPVYASPQDEADEADVAAPEPDVAEESLQEALAGALPEEDFEDGTWVPPLDADDEHPLGPAPDTGIQEAEYDLVEEEQAASEGEEDDPFSLVKYREKEAEPTEEAAPAEDVEEEAPAPEAAAEEEAEEPEEAPAPDVPPPPAAPPRKSPATAQRPRRRMPIAVIVLGVIGLAAGALFAYQYFRPAPQLPEGPVFTEGPAPADTSAQAGAVPPPATEDTTQAVQQEAPPPQEEPAPPANPTGGIDRAAGGWTIVVASVTTREDAQAILQRFLDLDLPADVLTATTNGVTRYRVGVGQFPSQEEAQAAIARLGESLPEGSWPLRIRPGM